MEKKKLSKLKLNRLSKIEEVELNSKAMQSLKGGECGWKCFWDFNDSKMVRRVWDPSGGPCEYGG